MDLMGLYKDFKSIIISDSAEGGGIISVVQGIAGGILPAYGVQKRTLLSKFNPTISLPFFS